MPGLGPSVDFLKMIISWDEWTQRMSLVKINKEDMDRVVMDFFTTEGHAKVAEIFEAESSTKMDVDVRHITFQMNVLNLIRSGNIESAIFKIYCLYPEIITSNPKVLFHLQQQCLINLIGFGDQGGALDLAQKVLVPLCIKNPEFLQEFERTMALFAFEDPKTCPAAELFDISHCIRVACEVNEAILGRQNRNKESRLSMLLKALIWVQNQLDEKVMYPRINNLITAKIEDLPLLD